MLSHFRGREKSTVKTTSQSSANYWNVTTLYQQMRSSGLSDAEVRRKAAEELAEMALRIRCGEEIPEPINSFRSLAAGR